jgi:flagellin-like protein
MKGISAVIATILMLLITIALAGVAYMYIQNTFSDQTAVVLQFDPVATFCNSTGYIYIAVRNGGTTPGTLSRVLVSGAKSDGAVISNTTGFTSFNCNATGTMTAGGGSVFCVPFRGSAGTNRVVISGYNTQAGTVSCTV